MSEYIYNDFQIVRRDNTIVIMNDRRSEIKKIILKPDLNLSAKLNISLSNMCTMKCKYCSEADYIRQGNKIISETDVYVIIDMYFLYILKMPYVKNIRLSFDYGGEPVCKLDILEKASFYFRNKCNQYGKNAIVQMTTNAAWDSELLPRIFAAVDEIIVSIDGYKELHEKYRVHKSSVSVFDIILNNTKLIYQNKRLTQISSVITKDTLENAEEYILFFKDNFPGTVVKMRAVITTGDAQNNNFERISLGDWKNFIYTVEILADGKLEILDSKPEKSLFTIHEYGCENMQMINWFYWLDGTITCCSDRKKRSYIIGKLENNNIILDYDFMDKISTENHIENISNCKTCIAKYYCAGGCPSFRNEKINCDKRIRKYAEYLINTIEL